MYELKYWEYECPLLRDQETNIDQQLPPPYLQNQFFQCDDIPGFGQIKCTVFFKIRNSGPDLNNSTQARFISFYYFQFKM